MHGVAALMFPSDDRRKRLPAVAVVFFQALVCNALRLDPSIPDEEQRAGILGRAWLSMFPGA